MTVGRYIRLVKFNSLLELLHQQCPVTTVVMTHNFFDQTHLTRDFKLFSGISPGMYTGPNYKLLHQALSNKKL